MNQSLIEVSEKVEPPIFVLEPRLSLARALVFVRSHAAETLSGVLLTIMCLQMLAVVWRKSITIDEIVMIPSAYYHLVDADFQLVNEHPPLSKILAAIPLVFVQPNEYT